MDWGFLEEEEEDAVLVGEVVFVLVAAMGGIGSALMVDILNAQDVQLLWMDGWIKLVVFRRWIPAVKLCVRCEVVAEIYKLSGLKAIPLGANAG